ncbi:MAG TPA: hypothetical protein DEP28_09045 [Bacteroidetes bacterium]|nr:hypothetical protein [Bacteroidota bacterium]
MKTLHPAVVCFLLFLLPVNFVASQNSNPVSSDSVYAQKDSIITEEIKVNSFMPEAVNVNGNLRFNIANSKFRYGNNAFEVIQKLPYVFAINENSISVNNNNNILIHVNGRSSNAYYNLTNIPYDKIDYIELNMTPGVRYSSSDISAIINIVLLKEEKMAYNGNINLSADSKEYYKGNLFMNTKIDDIYLFAMYDIGRGRNTFDTKRQRESDGQVMNSINTFDNSIYSKSRNNSISISGVYDFSKNSFIQVDFLDATNRNDGNGNYNIFNGNTGELERSDNSTNTLYKSDEKISAYLKHKFSEKTTLEGEVNISRNPDNLYTKNLNVFYSGANPENVFLNYEVHKDESDRQQYYSIDLAHKQSDKIKYESGISLNRIISTENYYMDTSIILNYLMPYSEEFDRNFSLNRDIYSVYTSFSLNDDSYFFQSSLRIEYSNDELKNIYHDFSNSVHVENKFDMGSKFYPVANLKFSKKISGSNEISLSVSKKLNRPNASQLNQFKINYDEYNFREGNQNLTPENIYNAELSYNMFNPVFSLRPSLNFKYSNDLIRRIAYIYYNQEDGTTTSYSTLINQGERLQYGADLYANIRMINNLFLSGSIGIFYTDFINIADINEDNKINLSGKLNVNYMFNEDFNVNANFSYTGFKKYALSVSDPVYYASLGITHTFFDKSLSVSLQGMDIFDTYKNSFTVYGSNYEDTYSTDYKMQSVMLNLSYNFGKLFENKNKKPKDRNKDKEEKNPDLH